MNTQEDPDFKNLVDLFGIFSEATNRLAEIDCERQKAFIESADEVRSRYVDAQTAQRLAEQSIIALAKKHPEWFKPKKTITTAYGTVQSRASKKLIVASEGASIALIKEARKATKFIRTVEELDLESLEKLPDDELEAFGITREKSESITVKAAVSDAGELSKPAEDAA